MYLYLHMGEKICIGSVQNPMYEWIKLIMKVSELFLIKCLK